MTQLDLADFSNSGWRVADGEARGRAVARLLRVSSSLITLILAYNKIGDEGAKALAAGVAASGSTAALYLDFNQISRAAKQSLRDAVQGRQGFSLNIIGRRGCTS